MRVKSPFIIYHAGKRKHFEIIAQIRRGVFVVVGIVVVVFICFFFLFLNKSRRLFL